MRGAALLLFLPGLLAAEETAFRLAWPWALLALVAPLLLLLWAPQSGGVAFGAFSLARRALRLSRGPLLHRLGLALGLAALIVALARPQYGSRIVDTQQSGRDFMLVLDCSGSMRTPDMGERPTDEVDRLEAVHVAAKDFIAARPGDRIGLTFFGDQATVACPPTTDHAMVVQYLEQIEQRLRQAWRLGEEGVLGSSTNSGLGLRRGLHHLVDNQPDEERTILGRSLILITDGVDSERLRNWEDPVEAAEVAQAAGCRVYCIGVGNKDAQIIGQDWLGRRRLMPVSRDMLPDMARLRAIATKADGRALPATDKEGLGKVFETLSELEPTPRTLRFRDFYSDRFTWPLFVGFVFLALTLLVEPRLRGPL